AIIYKRSTSTIADTGKDYAAMIWEGLHYQLMNPSTKNPVIPYPTHPDIPKRSNESHHLVAHDDVVQSIFASGKSKGRDVKMTQYYRIDSTQGTNRIPSALGYLTLKSICHGNVVLLRFL
ncbi:hypothetical protein Tco_0106589, partial [Tanacetum coccineum]